ncbi:lytic transglycosylase domain-containing protein [Dermatobacter hominis]|uniref:lytic transglycosylase domain-containing protein n=1 Tax=Dermatobacter hominis TaxID=2884263 RepID=UPI001D1292C6|nr:lytic transglycosylase domain-containing protein [Dermatobacter hominis]UDY36444.1 lytic transglycosylase domain-containing protein [Dermatobacter hominis]
MAVIGAALVLGAALLLPSQPAPPPPVPVGLSPEVAALPASSRTLDAAESRRDAAMATRDRDVADLADTQRSLGSVQEEARATAGLLGRRRAELAKVEAALEVRRRAVRAIAAEWFVSGTADDRSMDPALGADELQELRRQAVLGDAAAGAAGDAVAFLSARADALRAEVERLARGGERLGGRVDELTTRATELTADVQADEAAVASAEEAVTSARLNATVDGTDISTVALDAYWRAQRALALTDPGCRVSWWALAGIGRTESRHGTYLGSEVAADGAVTPPILGPPLDGSNGFRVVADSDGGALDGDATTDRAVGPMQFLPSTWRTVGRDGNGDGRADPDNVYDAALGAGAYLCRSGDLSGEAGLRSAYLTYNRSQTYVDTVIGFAHGYRDALPLAGAS